MPCGRMRRAAAHAATTTRAKRNVPPAPPEASARHKLKHFNAGEHVNWPNQLSAPHETSGANAHRGAAPWRVEPHAQ
jgi:hypothetical protein